MRYKNILILAAVLFVLPALAQEHKGEHKQLEKNGHDITSVCFSPDGKNIASGGTDGLVVIWDVASQSPVTSLKGHKDLVLASCYSPDGKYVATASKDKTVIIWSPSKGTIEKKLTGHTAAVTSVAFTYDGLLISGSADHTVKIWDVEKGTLVKTIQEHQKEVSAVALSPGGIEFATASYDGTVKIYNLSTGAIVKNIDPQAGRARAINFSPDKQHFAAAFDDKSVRVFDIRENTMLFTLRGHRNVIYDIEFSPDGQFIATGSLDNTVKIWSTETGEQRLSFDKFYNFVNLAFSPDGKTLATAEFNSKLKLWDVSSLKITPIINKPLAYTNNSYVTRKIDNVVSAPKTPAIPVDPLAKPKIDIIQPKVEPGKKLLYLEKEITIKGSVNAPNGVYEILVNGQEIPMVNDNDFTATIKLAYRDNNISIKVTDRNSNVSEETFVIERQMKIANVNDTMGRAGTDYALIIVTDEYLNFPKLSNPVNDGMTIANELEKLYGFKTEVVKNPTRSEIYTSIRNYSKKQFADDDELYIFIAGHGEFDEVFSEGYIVCKDSKADDEVKESFISHSNLRTIINNIPCKHILLTMDVCFGGTFDPFVATGRGISKDDPERAKFIQRKLQYTTRKYLTSGGKEYVPDGRPGYHSPFARKVLEALRSNGGTDKILTFGEFYNFIETVTPAPKAGEFGNNQPGSDFLFIGK